MKRKLLAFILILILVLQNGIMVLATPSISIDSGTILLDELSGKMGMVSVFKDDITLWYTVMNKKERLPIQLGNGNYFIQLYEWSREENGKSLYKKIGSEDLYIDKNNEEEFLMSSNPIYWNYDYDSIKLAKELTKNIVINEEKVKIIHNYIVNEIIYDWEWVKDKPTFYVPNIDNTLRSKKGVCYDYSALMAGMLRSLGIKTKLVKGYHVDSDVYHAWNEVFINNEWKLVDTTYDSAYVKAGRKVDIYKSFDSYIKESEF